MTLRPPSDSEIVLLPESTDSTRSLTWLGIGLGLRLGLGLGPGLRLGLGLGLGQLLGLGSG